MGKTRMHVVDNVVEKLAYASIADINLLRSEATRDINFLDLNLRHVRHDMKILYDEVRQLRAEVAKLKQGGEGPPTSA